MLISDTHHFIFVHIRKTGGSSMRQVLAPYSNPVPKSRILKAGAYLRLVRDYRRYPFGLHASLAKCQRVMPEALFSEAFKFGFVRNPWGRLASEYRFILSNPQHRRHKRIAKMQDIGEFIRYQMRREKGSQLEMLRSVDGALGVDFVGRFENLSQDFARACDRLDVPCPAALVHLNKGPVGDYRRIYDDDSAQLVADHWSEEIDAFDYRFDR